MGEAPSQLRAGHASLPLGAGFRCFPRNKEWRVSTLISGRPLIGFSPGLAQSLAETSDFFLLVESHSS